MLSDSSLDSSQHPETRYPGRYPEPNEKGPLAGPARNYLLLLVNLAPAVGIEPTTN